MLITRSGFFRMESEPRFHSGGIALHPEKLRGSRHLAAAGIMRLL